MKITGQAYVIRHPRCRGSGSMPPARGNQGAWAHSQHPRYSVMYDTQSIPSFASHDSLWIKHYGPHFRDGKAGSERLENCPKSTEPGRGRAHIQTWVSPPLMTRFSPPCLVVASVVSSLTRFPKPGLKCSLQSAGSSCRGAVFPSRAYFLGIPEVGCCYFLVP